MWQVKRWHVWLWHVIWWCDTILWHVICWCDSESHCIATCADLLQGWLPCSVQTHSSQGLYPEVTSSVHQRSVERRGCQIPSQGRRSLACHFLMAGGEGSHCWNQSPPGYFVKNWIFLETYFFVHWIFEQIFLTPPFFFREKNLFHLRIFFVNDELFFLFWFWWFFLLWNLVLVSVVQIVSAQYWVEVFHGH